MSGLDEVMLDVEKDLLTKRQVLNYLRLLNEIIESGDCNTCDIQNGCPYKPSPGNLVRYNCPFYKSKEEKLNEQH